MNKQTAPNFGRLHVLAALTALAIAMGAQSALFGATEAPAQRPVQIGTLTSIAFSLSRLSGHRIEVDDSERELRVACAFPRPIEPRQFIEALARLTASRTSMPEKGSWTIEQSPRLQRAIDAWPSRRLAALLLQRARKARESEEAAEVSRDEKGLQGGHEGGANGLALLADLTSDQLLQLCGHGSIAVPVQSLRAKGVDRLLRARFSMLAQSVQQPIDQIVSRQRAALEKSGLVVEVGAPPDELKRIYVYYRFAHQPSFPAVTIGKEELYLPISRGNPYGLLTDQPVKATPLPGAFSQPIPANLVADVDNTWHSTLRHISDITGMPCYSDDYLFRPESTLPPQLGGERVLAERGISMADALNRACERFGYLWWYEGGACYFRSRGFPYDEQAEVPTSLIFECTKQLRKDGSLSPRTLTEALSLSPARFHSLVQITNREVFTPHAYGVFDRGPSQGFLPFYRGLSISARQELVSAAGLSAVPGEDPVWQPLETARAVYGPQAELSITTTQRASEDTRNAPDDWAVLVRVTMLVVRHPRHGFAPVEFTLHLPNLPEYRVGSSEGSPKGT